MHRAGLAIGGLLAALVPDRAARTTFTSPGAFTPCNFIELGEGALIDTV